MVLKSGLDEYVNRIVFFFTIHDMEYQWVFRMTNYSCHI